MYTMSKTHKKANVEQYVHRATLYCKKNFFSCKIKKSSCGRVEHMLCSYLVWYKCTLSLEDYMGNW